MEIAEFYNNERKSDLKLIKHSPPYAWRYEAIQKLASYWVVPVYSKYKRWKETDPT